MNGLVSFRLCTLTDEELIKKIDQQTDDMFRSQKVPSRNIPARPNEDYDLLVGELMMRFNERVEPRTVNIVQLENKKIKVEKTDVFAGQDGVHIKGKILTANNIDNYDLYKIEKESTENKDVFKIKKEDEGFYIIHDKIHSYVDWFEDIN